MNEDSYYAQLLDNHLRDEEHDEDLEEQLELENGDAVYDDLRTRE